MHGLCVHRKLHLQLYVLVIVRLARRELVWINVTAHPTAEWIEQQLTEAFPWTEIPRYLIRDRDGIYGAAVTRRLRANRQSAFVCFQGDTRPLQMAFHYDLVCRPASCELSGGCPFCPNRKR